MKYEKGDIVLSPVVYPDNNKRGSRLLVLVDKNEAVSLYDGLNITTSEKQNNYNGVVPIKKSEQNSLNSDSFVKPNVIYELDDEIIVHKIGEVEKDYLNTITSNLEKMTQQGLITRQPISSIKEYKSKEISKQKDGFEKE